MRGLDLLFTVLAIVVLLWLVIYVAGPALAR